MYKFMLKPILVTSVLLLTSNLAFADCVKPKTQKKYDSVSCLNDEGLARANFYGKWGYVDKRGNVAISFQYDYAYDFKGGYAIVVLNGQGFKIDVEGNRVK